MLIEKENNIYYLTTCENVIEIGSAAALKELGEQMIYIATHETDGNTSYNV